MPFKLENQLIDGTLTRRALALHALVIRKPNTAISHVSKLLSLHSGGGGGGGGGSGLVQYRKHLVDPCKWPQGKRLNL
jgi:hypothetical protein